MSERDQLGPSTNGSVVLDIGGDIGALVLLTPESFLGIELEISHVDADPESHRPHVAVRERLSPAGVQYAAIYPSLRSGEYILWSQIGEPADRVQIVGGHVAQLDWR